MSLSKIQERPSRTARAGSGLLHLADLTGTVTLRRMPDRAPLGERVSERVSADAVGRRGRFFGGAVPIPIRTRLPLRKTYRAGAIESRCADADLDAPPKAEVGTQGLGQGAHFGTATIGQVSHRNWVGEQMVTESWP